MFKAAICEDQSNVLRYIESGLRDAFAERGVPVEFRTYGSGESLLESVSQVQQSFDMFFLDIEMPGVNGIELCRQLRTLYPKSLVVFISNREELVFQTFEVRPFRFIRKQHFDRELPEVVHAVVNELRSREGEELYVQEQNSDALYVWPIQQIISVEALSKFCRVRTLKGQDTLRYRFMDLEAQLTPHGFIKPHRSFLVNYRFIAKIEKNAILLDDGTQIPISRGKKDETRLAFVKLMNEGAHSD